MLPLPYWITVAVTGAVVIVCVGLHYECLRFLSRKLPKQKDHHRQRIITLIVCLLLLHSTEIWLFGSAYFFLQGFAGFGGFVGIAHLQYLDSIYFSASVFTTLGFGDIAPIGAIRFVTGVEALTGLTFITWSASFTYLEMLKTLGEEEA